MRDDVVRPKRHGGCLDATAVVVIERIELLCAALSCLVVLGGCASPLDGESGPDADTEFPGDGNAGRGDGPGPVVALEGSVSTPSCFRPPAGEGIANLIDGDDQTKFLGFGSSVWVQYDAGEPYFLDRYAITSANDFDGRDPYSWILSGSNDGHTWTQLDVRVAEDFPERFQRREFEVKATEFYRYYHLRMENVSDTALQLAELELFGGAVVHAPAEAPPAPPAALSATAVSRSQIDLAWQDDAGGEALYRIEASVDGAPFATAGYAPADASQFSAVGLSPDQEVAFRVVAVNAAGEAASSPGVARTQPPIPRTANGDGTVTYAEGRYQVTVDADGQNIDPAYIEGLVSEYFAVYPQMAADFNPSAPTDLSVTFDPEYDGIAYATFGTGSVTISSEWARGASPTSLDVIAHEGFHIVQGYLNERPPGWVIEGLADYARFRYGNVDRLDCWQVQHYREGMSYTDAYGVTARFLLWIEANIDPDIATALDDTSRAGTYADSFWTERTGKTIDQLWTSYATDSERVPLDYQ